MPEIKSRVFIGSSTEDLRVANAIQARLDFDTEATVWNQDIFKLSQFSLESLSKALDASDFAVFIVCPNDVVSLRGEQYTVSRDNVIFELGMFIGRIGRERTFLVMPREEQGFHMPTDLLGLTPATYDSKRSDNNTSAAVGAACTNILEQIKHLGPLNSGTQKDTTIDFGMHYYEDGRMPLEVSAKMIESATSEVIVVGSSLRAFVARMESEPDDRYKRHILEALARGVNFIFAVMNPNGKLAKDFALERNDTELVKHTITSIAVLTDLVKEVRMLKLKGQLEVRTYRRIPFAFVLLVDREKDNGGVIISKYLPATKKAHSPSILLNKLVKPIAFSRYKSAVEEILRTSTTVKVAFPAKNDGYRR